MAYHLLDDLPDDHPLTPRPVQIWILLTVEIVVRTPVGRFLVAKQPYYSDAADPESLFEGAWAPPFVGVPVPQRYDIAGTPRILRSRFAEVEEDIRPIELIQQFLYEMGVENPSIEERQPFVEIKSSPRNPHVVKAYKIRRFAVHSDLSTSKSNLADPDGRKGFVFIPLDDLDRYVTRGKADDGKPVWMFLGLPLMTNLATVLSAPAEINRLKSSAIEIGSEYFFHDQYGLVLVLDLSGYGRTVRYVAENMNSLDAGGRELADFFRARLAQWFAELLAAIGARQIQHAGDGFVCALNRADAPALKALGAELRKFQDRIEQISAHLPDEYQLGTRFAVHAGNYRYGRVGSALSAVPGFDGETVVTAVRLEQALAAHAAQSHVRHIAVTSLDEQSEELLFPGDDWVHTAEPVTLESKEFRSMRRIWTRGDARRAVR
ncbi:hypothetical protein EEZ25_26180 [Micromonospora aurantiaca]|uniref:hypothetical protein n=1 Tax=Micromonospora aurantiaca (nom. illeg.) TaxID=47850 RepID=UPI000F3E1458|nr:hypothetical protein [Micromonospora aurantiaca]RNH98592.1 hypothetical protein EEZ25_26180 [Micromonospora aurantiaca]